MSRRERTAVGLVAAAAWTGLLLQADVSFTGMRANGLSVSDACIRFFSYFTILTNSVIALETLFCFITARSRWSKSLPHSSLETAMAVSIFFVAVCFFVLLRHVVHFTGLALVAEYVLHYLVPTLFLLYWGFFSSRHHLPLRHALWWVAYPFFYFLYLLAQGWRTGLYPYPFINAAEIGYHRTLINGAMLLLLFWIAGLIFIKLARILHRPPVNQSSLKDHSGPMPVRGFDA